MYHMTIGAKHSAFAYFIYQLLQVRAHYVRRSNSMGLQGRVYMIEAQSGVMCTVTALSTPFGDFVFGEPIPATLLPIQLLGYPLVITSLLALSPFV
jgi:hypothetical protein